MKKDYLLTYRYMPPYHGGECYKWFNTEKELDDFVKSNNEKIKVIEGFYTKNIEHHRLNVGFKRG